MKKLAFYLLLLLIIPVNLKAQAYGTVGAGGNFSSLKAAFEFINNSGTSYGDIYLEIISNVTETTSALLYESGHDGLSYYNSITIYPTTTGLTVSGNFDGPLIVFNGASNVIIDGRLHSTQGPEINNSKDLIIINQNTGNSASTIKYAESANNNTVKFCTVKGSGAGSLSGVLFFSTSSSGAGNSNNSITNNDITSNGSAIPVNLVYSSGSAGALNNGNTISSNNLYNFLKQGTSSNGILLSANTTTCTIADNSFYETASFAPTADVTYNAILINTSGGGFNVTGNFIGGKDVLCGGTAFTKTTGHNNPFYAINLNVGTLVSSSVQKNTIKNFAWSNSGNASWTGINIESGAVNIGTELGNIIGDPSSAGSVTITGGAANTQVMGINISGSGMIDCQKNGIANILNATTSSGSIVSGISVSSNSLTNKIDGNFIHHLSVSASSTGSSIYGIRINSGATTYSNNIVALGGNTPTVIHGIYETGAAGNNNNLFFNTVYIYGSPASGASNSYALYSAVTTNSRDFRNNIFDNSRSNSGATGTNYAVYIASPGGTLTIDYNNYYATGTGGILGFFGGDITILPAWKTATGQDGNSQAANPLFASVGSSAPEGYLPSSALIAVPGLSVLTDFAGSTRSLTSPYMGAFEVGLCTNPTSGGIIASNQTGCAPFDPVVFTNTQSASGHLGILEYKWQQSTVNGTSGFSDIAGTNSVIYDAGPRLVTTWYKRLARVTCSTDWTGAAESNVAEVTVNSIPTATITGILTSCETTTLTAVTDAVSPLYTWFKDFAIISGETSSSLLVDAGGSYKVKVTSGITTCSQTSAPSAVTINELPVVSISGSLTACVTTTLTAVNNAPSPVFVWYKNNVIIPGESASTLVITSGGDYKVKVTNGITSCERTTLASTVIINPLPTASITGTLTSCVTTTLTTVSDALSPSYVWYKNSVVIAGETAATLVVTTSGDYKVKVINGITTCEQTSAVSTVTINPLPSASITGTLTACVTTTLTAVSDALSPSYTWYKNNVVIGGETASTLVVTSSGDYKVKVTNGVTSCEQTSSASTVTINPLPSASITGTLTACVTTTLTSVSDALSPSYVWYRNNIVIGGETSSTLVVVSSGDYKVKIINGVTSCENTSSASTVTINVLPSASVSGLLTACSSTTLTAVTDAVSPAYVWYKNSAAIPGETASALNVTSGGDYKVKVTNGVTSCEQTSAVSTVTINPLPTASINGTLTACITTTLTAVTNAVSPSFIWYKDNAVVAGETTSTLVTTSSGDYKVKVTNGITSCEQTSSVSTVIINPLPSATITGTMTACATTTLTAVSNALSPSFIWYKNNVVIGGETASTLIVTSNGDYKVKVTNGVTSCEQTSAASTVIINPLPSASITGTLTACVTTTLTAVSAAVSPSYAWYKNNAVIGGETASTLVVTASGDYKVKVTNGVTSCEQTSSASTVIINPLPSASIIGTLTACVTTTLSAASDAVSPSYVWYKNNVIIGGETASTLVVNSGGVYKVKVTNGVTSCEQTSSASTVIINPLPSASITGTLAACATTTLTAVSDALSPSYMWYKNNVVIGGETASTLVVASGGDYKVKVTNGITSCEQTSAVSTVTINPLPTASITGTLTACITTTLTAVTNAVAPSFIWYKDNAVVAGETTSTLVTTSSGDYKVKVTNGITSCEFASPVSTVIINPLPSVNLTVNGTATVCSGTSSDISVMLSETGVLYQLRNSAGNVNVGSPVTGTGGTIILPTGNLTSPATFNILATRVSSVCSVQLTGTISLTIDANSVGGIVNATNSSLTYGSATGDMVLTGYTGTIIKWLKTSGSSAWTDIPSISSAYSEIPISAGTWQYRAQIKNGGCPAVYSEPVNIAVVPKTLTITADNKEKHFGEANPALTLTFSGFVLNDDKSVLDVLPLAVTTAELNSAVGNYDILVSGGSDVSYSFVYIKGVLTITKASQTITFETIPSGLRMTQEHTLVATATSGLPVSFTISDPISGTITGNILKMLKDSPLTITATQAGDSNWNPAVDVTQTITILPTFDNISSLFTPNNDGMNDLWYIPDLNSYGQLEVTVYNRYGQTVYKSNGYKNNWDGTLNGNPLPSGSYYYLMKSSTKGSLKGVVNILR